MRLRRFWDRVRFTIIALLMGLLFLSRICWGGIPTVTSVTPATGTTYSTQDVVISGSNFEPGAKVSLLNGGLFLNNFAIPVERVIWLI